MKNYIKYVAEAMGTFLIVFIGTGSVVVSQETHLFDKLIIAIAFGFAVSAAIYQLNKYCNAHFNPAVTLAFWISGLFPKKEVLPNIVSQLIGAFAASFSLKIMFEKNIYLGTTLPSGTPMQSFWLEFLLTFILMLVILFASQSKGVINKLAGFLIGLTVFFEAYFAGPICGASMNPARSIAPAFVSGHTEHLWIYISAPAIGAVLSVFAWKFFKPKAN